MLNQRGLSQAFIIILVALLTAGIVGGGVWYWQQKQVDKANQEKLDKESEFSKKLQEASKEETKTEDKTSTETKDETAGWKTYVNEKYDFSVKYPPSWTVTEPGQIIFENGKKYSITMMINPDGNDAGMADKTISYTGKIVNNKLMLSDKKESTSILGSLEGDGKINYRSVSTYFKNGNDQYQIFGYANSDSELEELDKDFKQILETMTFN